MSVKHLLFGADLTWCPVAVSLVQLAFVVSLHESAKFPGQIPDSVEVPCGLAARLRHFPTAGARTTENSRCRGSVFRAGSPQRRISSRYRDAGRNFRAAGAETSKAPCCGLGYRFQRLPVVWAVIDMEARDSVEQWSTTKKR